MATGRTAMTIREMADKSIGGNSQIGDEDMFSEDALEIRDIPPVCKRRSRSVREESIEEVTGQQSQKRRRADNKKTKMEPAVGGIVEALRQPFRMEPLTVNPSAELLYWMEALEVWRKEFDYNSPELTIALRNYWQANPMKAKGFAVATPGERQYEIKELAKTLNCQHIIKEEKKVKSEFKDMDIIVLLPSSDIES